MLVNGMDTRDISIVIQGAVDKINTPKCVKSLRKYFPGSQIIVSTWEGTNINALDADDFILSKDPGGFRDKFCTTFVNNTLRQIVSTKAGVARATGQYILKIRSDLIFKSSNFLNLFTAYPHRNSDKPVFSQRVIFSSFFTKSFCSSKTIDQPLPFHVSDWFVFGYADDVQFLYDIELPKEPLNSWYLSEINYQGVKPNLLGASHRYAPEQYIFFSACAKVYPEIEFAHYMDYTRDNITWSDRLIANNCIILDPWQCRFICGKARAGNDRYKKWTIFPITVPKSLKKGLYLNKKFNTLYKKYCVNGE